MQQSPAKYLVNGDTVYVSEGGEVEYWHILFDSHQIVYANGAPSESFHPGEQAMDSLDTQARAEVLELLPELKDRPKTGYGVTAAPVLRKREAQALFSSSSLNPVPMSGALHARVTCR